MFSSVVSLFPINTFKKSTIFEKLLFRVSKEKLLGGIVFRPVLLKIKVQTLFPLVYR